MLYISSFYYQITVCVCRIESPKWSDCRICTFIIVLYSLYDNVVECSTMNALNLNALNCRLRVYALLLLWDTFQYCISCITVVPSNMFSNV